LKKKSDSSISKVCVFLRNKEVADNFFANTAASVALGSVFAGYNAL
jgi:hypothetical protein